MKNVKLFEQFINETFIGPFVFNDSMSDEELKAMYQGALDGFAYWQKGFQYPKADYKKVYQEIEKILKKRGINVDESFINEAKTLTRDDMMATMRNKYGLSFVRTTEEFDGEEGGIWLGGSDGKLMPNAKDEMFNYNHGGSKYPQGVHKDLAKFLDKCGWYGQFADPGTIMLWPR